MGKISEDIRLTDNDYENMFSGFTEDEQLFLQNFLDDVFPINEDDWTKN